MNETQDMNILKHSPSANGDSGLSALQCYVYACIISADNDEFGLSEEDKQEIIRRKKLDCDWDYVLEPIKDEKQRKTLVEFLKNDGIDIYNYDGSYVWFRRIYTVI